MKKLLLFSFFLLFVSSSNSQTLLNAYNFPDFNSYDYFWGITEQNGNFWIGSDYDYSSGTYYYSWMYKVNKTGQILDSLQTNFKFNHGLAWDGTNFWVAQDYGSSGAKIYKMSPTGARLDSIVLASNMQGIAGLAKDGNGLWFSVYSPDFPTYPRSYAYRVDLTTKAITDTIPLRGSQVQGIAVKGDTIFYVNDAFATGDPERIYAYSRTTRDTIKSWATPDPDGSCNPKGMYWDGQYLWLIAERAGGTAYIYTTLYKYDIFGAGTPILTTTAALPFGDVKIGSPVTLNQLIQNTGTGALQIDSVRIDNSYFSVLNSTGRDVIEPGQFKNYQVKFTPAVYGDQTATLRVYSNDGINPVKSIAVTARGIYGPTFLNTNPAVVKFNGRRLNSRSYLEITFNNYGSAQLKIDSVSKRTPNFYTELLTTPVTVDSVQGKTFRLWFNPTSYSSFKDTLRIYSNASNGALINLPLEGMGSAFDSTLGKEYWYGQVPPNHGTSSQNYQVRAMLPINDVNGDGKKDLIVCTANYWTICYNGNSSVEANILWKVTTIPNNNDAGSVEWIGNLFTDTDLTGDGINDVVIGTTGGSESVFLINGKTGQIVWENGDPTNYSNGDIMGVDAKRDFNNDGVKDVLATASGNESSGDGRFSILCLNGLNGTPIWTINQATNQKLKYMITSTDDGGAAGSRVSTTNEVVGFNKQGLITWIAVPTGTPWTVREIPNIGGGSGSDVIVGTTSGYVHAYAGNNGQVLWSKSIGSVFIEDLRIINDVNGNGTKDILVSGINPGVHVLEGSTGVTLWSNFTGGNILSVSELDDLNGDGSPEVITGSLDYKMDMFDGKNGNNLYSYSFGSTSGSAVDMVSNLDDLDANGSNEFAAGTRDGRVYMFSGGTNGIPVPVELSSLSASVDKNEVTLNWTTATELNNRGFVIQRRTSENPVFVEVGFVKGNGTVSEKHSYSFTDKKLEAGIYFYRLKQTDFNGALEYSSELEVNIGLPIEYALEQNYPNPFNPSTTIRYSIPNEGNVRIRIFNSVGEEVAQIVNEIQKAGIYQVQWNGISNSGSSVSSGIYFYRIESGDFVSVRKMMMLK